MAPGNRNWCFTVNNWTPSDWSALVAAPCRYLCMGQEKGAGGTPHIQGFMVLTNQKSFSAMRAWFAALLGHERAHLEAARGDTLQNLQYTSKEGGVFFEKGDRPMTPKEKGDGEKDRAKRNLDAILEGRIEDVDTDVVAHNLRNYEYGAAALKRARRSKPVALDGMLDNVWVWGPAGSGKDRFVLAQIGDRPHYLKSAERYWDGYDDEEDVIIRDFSGGADVRDLKIWSDRYPFDGRRMFGRDQCVIRPQRLWVTANYHPDEFFKGPDGAAMRRRYQIIHLADGVATYEPREAVAVPAAPRVVRRPTPPEPASPDRFSSAMSDL